MSSGHGTLTPHYASEGGDADGDASWAGNGGPSGVQAAPCAQQQQAQLAALLSFKPSSRDVISGIAPHVFDDQRYRPRRRRRASSPDCRRRSSSPMPRKSPLRLSAVEEHGASFQPKREDDIVIELYTPTPTLLPPEAISNSLTPTAQSNKQKRRTFRIDRVLKTLILRLK